MVKVAIRITSDPSVSITNLQSTQLTRFLSAFSNLSLVLISAKKEDREKIMSILIGCVNDTILPSIKNAAEYVLKSISYQKTSLQWSSLVSYVRIINSAAIDKAEESISISFHDYLDIANNIIIDEAFKSVYQRRNKKSYVKLSYIFNTITSVKLKHMRIKTDTEVMEAIRSTSIHVIEVLKEMGCLNRETHLKLSIIIDTNCSLRKNKLRMRTIVSCILVTVMKELGISLNLFVLCGRSKGISILVDDSSICEIISFLFDLEKVVTVPSAPLDVLAIEGKFNKKDPVVIISDGFSEQLMSQDDEVRNMFRAYSKLFLICLKGKDDEALSAANQSLLEKSLAANFHSNMMIIEDINSFLNSSKTMILNLFFHTQTLKMNESSTVISTIDFARDLLDDLSVEFKINKSVVFISTIAKAKSTKIVNVSNDDLLKYPESINDNTVYRKLNAVIQGENLFDALSTSLFVENELTFCYDHKYPLFKNGSRKYIRSYNACIVIDCSSIAFSETNRVHSLITIFTIIRNLSNLQLPCVDVWVASSKIIRIATGISSMDLWESNIVAILYESLLSPCQNTCLPDCIRFACCTCIARSFQSVMMILTNGVLCDESRVEIRSIVSGIEMTYLGIGIGLYLCGYEDLFPTMIWNSNPNQLSLTIMNMAKKSENKEANAVPEKPIDSMILNKSVSQSYKDTIERICNIPCIYETTKQELNALKMLS